MKAGVRNKGPSRDMLFFFFLTHIHTLQPAGKTASRFFHRHVPRFALNVTSLLTHHLSVRKVNGFDSTLSKATGIYSACRLTGGFPRSSPSTVTLACPDSRPPAVLVSQPYTCPSYTSTLLILRVPLGNSLKRESWRKDNKKK